MRNPRDFLKPLAIDAPEPLREIPFRPSRMIHFLDFSNEKMVAQAPDIATKTDILLGNLEDAVPVDRKEAAREGLIRVQNCVGPKSVSRPIVTRPSREISLFSAFTASSRLPSSTSTCFAMSGILAAIFALLGSKKWIMREGLNGISVTGSGAPTARGLKKSRGFLIRSGI